MEESLNWKNGIHGMIMRPCSLSNKENDKVVHSSDYSVKKNFLQEYQNHIAAMQIVAECAKVFILKNWKKVKDWSKLNVVIEDASENPTEYFNYIPREKSKHKDSKTFEKMFESLEKSDKKRHNPITSISDVVLDPTDGDFSLTINGKDHLWILDDSIIVIANYIEEQLNKQKEK